MIPSFTFKLLLAALTATAPVAANNPIVWDDFWQDGGKRAAMAAVPMYHFGAPRGKTPCYPEDAEYNGVQVDGNDPGPGDYCTNLHKGCRSPGPLNGRNSPGAPFPVYYTIKECSGKVRVAYSIYFRHDSGHKSDWENVIVTWTGNGAGGWIREKIHLSFHGGWNVHNWGDIQNTVDGEADKMTQDAKDRDHAKVYVGSFYHAIFHTRKTSLDTCSNRQEEFRSNDWQILPWGDLVKSGDAIKSEWTWGKANTNPATLRDNLCEK